MKSRIGKALAALLMHLIFGLLNLAAWLVVWLAIVAWVITGDEWLYDWIKNVGKSEDQTTNTAWFGGHPKEVLSSHVGRLILRQRRERIPAPWWAVAIAWLLDLADDNHAVDSIEEPFIDEPL